MRAGLGTDLRISPHYVHIPDILSALVVLSGILLIESILDEEFMKYFREK
jgi:hypothetical protein